jgi:hypothetical protein
VRDEIANHEAENIRLALKPYQLNFTVILARLLGFTKLSLTDRMIRVKADTKDYDLPVNTI